MNDNSNDILERLKHPEREAQRRQDNNRLFLRNILNGVFMLMAATAMIGLLVTWKSPQQPTWCYILGLSAVVVKMCEAMLRMPGMKQTPRHPRSAGSTLSSGHPGAASGGKPHEGKQDGPANS